MGNWPEVAVVQLSDSSANLIESIENFINQLKNWLNQFKTSFRSSFYQVKRFMKLLIWKTKQMKLQGFGVFFRAAHMLLLSFIVCYNIFFIDHHFVCHQILVHLRPHPIISGLGLPLDWLLRLLGGCQWLWAIAEVWSHSQVFDTALIRLRWLKAHNSAFLSRTSAEQGWEGGR